MSITVDQAAAWMVAAGFTRKNIEVSYKQGRGGVYKPGNYFYRKTDDAFFDACMDVERDNDAHIRIWQARHCTNQHQVMFHGHNEESFIQAIRNAETVIFSQNGA